MSTSATSFIGTITAFLTEIGIETEFGPVPQATFLPGLSIHGGTIRVDPANLLSPGDILHEAGHLALTPPVGRADQTGTLDSDPGIEMSVIAWTYAAALHLGIPPDVVFHSDGYRGGAQSLLENFRQGRYVGVPILQWLGLTYEPGPAQTAGMPPYPHMLAWMRK